MLTDESTLMAASATESFKDYSFRIPERYRVLGESGRGGMGVVLKAFDTQMKRVVAVKLLRKDHLLAVEAGEFVKRFRREWQVMAGLSHPNIVTLFEAGEYEGVPYFVMEYLEGKPLLRVLKETGSLPVDKVVTIFSQLCDATGYAHGRGIVHRDLKPSNLMLLDTGILKVTDFGVARTISSDLTQTGIVLGTMRYKSPEELRGNTADHRSDIFSLGIILQELLTGQHPFDAPSGSSVIERILCADPKWPSEPHGAVSPQIRSVVSKALAKSPESRYRSCDELFNDLRTAVAAAEPAGKSATLGGVFRRKFSRIADSAYAEADRICGSILPLIKSLKPLRISRTVLVTVSVLIIVTSSAILARRSAAPSRSGGFKHASIYGVVGFVQFPTGPAPGLTVDLRNLQTGSVRETKTGSQGTFRLNATSSGPYELSVPQQPGVPTRMSAPVTLIAGRVARHNFVVVPPPLPATLSGSVLDDHHQPIHNFEVVVSDRNTHHTVTIMGSNGSYQLQNLIAGPYDVRIKASGPYRRVRNRRISLAPGEAHHLDFVLTAVQQHNTSGEVCGSALAKSAANPPSAQLQLVDEASTVIETVLMDRSGGFCFEHVPKGVYSVQAVTADGWSLDPVSGIQVEGNKIVDINLLFHPKIENAPLAKVAVLRGIVEAVDRQPMPFVHVSIANTTSPAASVVTDSNGEFDLTLEPGEYKVSVSSTSLFTGGSTNCVSGPQSVPSHCVLILNPALIFRVTHHHVLGSSAGYLIVTKSDIVFTPTPAGSSRRLHFVTSKISQARTAGKSDFEFSYEHKQFRFSIFPDPMKGPILKSFRSDPATLKRAITDFDSVIQTIQRSKPTR